MFKKARRSLFQRSTSSSPLPKHTLAHLPPTSTQSFVMPTLTIRPAPPPPAPYPWVWKCHSCHSTYRLGTTRRCLECGHEMCSSAGDATSRSRQSPTKAGRRAKKRRRTGGPCRSEFDYAGWAAWGEWKRGRLTAEAKDAALVDGSYSCADYCDYPSECHHTRYRIAHERFEAEAKAALERSEKKKSGLGSITVTNTITQFFSSATENPRSGVSSSVSCEEDPPASLFEAGGDESDSDNGSDSNDSSSSDEADEILSKFIIEPCPEETAFDEDECEDDASSGLIIFGATPVQLTNDERKAPKSGELVVELFEDYRAAQIMDDDEDEDEEEEDEDSLKLQQQRRSFSKVAQLTGLESLRPPNNTSLASLPSNIHSFSSEIVSTCALSYSLPSLRPEGSDHISDRSLSASPPVRLESPVGMTEDSVTAWWVEFGRL
ncbi:hypothetical protein PspLS_02669 [Pyricularia sp. CBS 133598]|nr:hypothetical protein PspLS_02669 [Pyricularia sp. CBS 133598]